VSTFVEKIAAAISRHNLIRDGDSVLVAASGGVDSMVLVRTLSILAPKHHWKLAIAHFNHRLRGRSSDADQRFVERTAKAFGIGCYSGAGDVKQAARDSGTSIEMAARRLRHEFLASTAVNLGIKQIALGHHADDKIELFFLRLLRGAGPEGLCGLKWSNASPYDPKVRLLRPFLEVGREAITSFAKSERIRFREDATNAHCEFLRNRVRHRLLPFIRSDLQPALSPVIQQTIDILEVENDYVRQEVIRAKAGKIPFLKWHPALQRRSILEQLAAFGVEQGFELVERLRANPGVSFSVGPDLSLCLDNTGTVRHRQVVALEFDSGSVQVDLSDQAGVIVFDGLTVQWRKIPPPSRIGKVPGRELFNSKKVGGQITLRHWQPGDRFQPIGLAQTVKLQDIFVNNKVEMPLRRKLAVGVSSEGEIFWVEGQRIGERFKLDKDTQYALEWIWRRQ